MRKSIPVKLFSLFLAVIMTAMALPLNTFAETVQNSEIHYIKEIRLEQAETKEEAKASLEDDGFFFLDSNLNEGTDEEGVWLGYKTTTDPTEAIYDMKLMNTDGGFTITSMEEAIKAQESMFTEMALDLELLIDEFVDAYKSKAKYVPAQKAYKALNFFRIVDDETKDDEENGLGYQIVNGGLNTEMITEIIMLCDSAVIDSIVKILTMGIQLTTSNWMKRLSDLGPYEEDVDYGLGEDGKVRLTDDEIKRRADQLEAVIKFYADAYNSFDELGLVSGKLDDSFNVKDATYQTPGELTADELAAKKADESRYKFYKVVFDEFQNYDYGEGETLKDFFRNEPTSEDLYPLVSVLSDGEYAAMSYGCFLEVALGAKAEAKDFDHYDDAYADATKEIDSLYLYVGVDKALLGEDSIVAFTDTATRHMAATGELEFFENQTLGERAWEKGVIAAKCIGCIGLVVMAVPRIVAGATILATSIISYLVGHSATTAVTAAIIKFGSMIGGPWTLLITVVAVALTLLISFLISVIDEAVNGKIDWDDNPMPEYLYDVRNVSFIQQSENEGVATEYVKRPVFCFYEAVRDENGEIVDLNARSKDASQWIGLYVSYDNLGDDAKPIKADDLLVKMGNGETPEGYKPLTRFDEVIAYNLNQWDDEDEVNGIYVFYKQDETAPPVKQDETYYISDVYLQKGESDAHCIALLEAMGYTPLNVNLSPDTYITDKWDLGRGEQVYTYIGYKTTTLPTEAYRDLRLVYGPTKGEIQIGGANYADCGSNGFITLYGTKYEGSGTPILAGGLQVVNDHSEASAGFEPINFFSGGPAVNFNVRNLEDDLYSYRDAPTILLYFLPETTFTGGTKYIGGISYHYVYYSTVEYIEKNNRFLDYYLEYFKKVTGQEYDYESTEQFLFDYEMRKSGYHQITDTDLFESVAYYYTYNPYRAIYGMKMTTLESREFNFKVENIGYARWSAVMLYEQRGGLTPIYRESHVAWESYHLELNGDLYLSGNPSSSNKYNSETGKMTEVQPLTPEDVICLTDYNKNDYTSLVNNKELGYQAVTDVFFGGITKISNRSAGVHGPATPWLQNHFTFYVRSNTEDRPYISDVMVADVLSQFRGAGGSDAGLRRKNITDGMLYKNLAAQGATNFCGHRVSMRQEAKIWAEMNAMLFGYKRTATKKEALTDMFITVSDVTFGDPPDTIYRDNVAYNLICNIPYNLTGYDGAPGPGVYLYGTTDTRAGGRIIEFTVSGTPFKDGYETIRTKDGRSPWSELRDMMEENRSTHFLSWAKELFKDLRDFFTIRESDHEEHYFEHAPYYFHIKREGDSLLKQKPYVEKLYLAAYSADNIAVGLEDLFDQGAEEYDYHDLNEGTWFGSHIIIGLSRTASKSDAIKDIKAYHEKNPLQSMYYYNDGVLKYDLVRDLDLNKGAGGNYIYLYTTKDGSSAPITDIYVDFYKRTLNKSYYKESADYKQEVADYVTYKWNTYTFSDLNKGAGGEDVFLYYQYACGYKPDGTYKKPNYGTPMTFDRNRLVEESELDPSGKYIAELFVMDKETIRQELSISNCEAISEQKVFARLKEMGATEIITTPININCDDFNYWNNNKVYIGYNRTNNPEEAIKDIAIHTELLTYSEPAENLSVDRRGYQLVAEAAKGVKELPKAINLLSIGNGNQVAFPKMYLYVSYTTNSLPITNICIDSNPLLQGWNTARSSNGLDPFVDIQLQALEQYKLADKDDLDSYDHELVYTDSLFEWMDDLAAVFDPEEEDISTFYIHTKNYTENTVEEARPYIEEIYVAEGDSRHDALTQLVAYSPDGFIDVDLNKNADGKYVYLAYKRTAKSSYALRDLMVYAGSDPKNVIRVLVGNTRIRYDLTTSVDLNSEAGGPYLYLYATDSRNIGDPIKSIGISEGSIPSYYVKCGIERNIVSLVERDSNTNIDKFTGEYIDLNKGAGGAYLYMYMIRETDAGHTLTGQDQYTESEEPTCGDDGYELIIETCTACGQEVEKETILPATGHHVDESGDGDHRCDICRERNVTGCVRGEPEKEDIVPPYKDEDGNLVEGSYSLVYYCTECEDELSREEGIVIPATPENIAKYAEKVSASMFGDGSIVSICVFVAVGIVAAILIPIIIKKKRR